MAKCIVAYFKKDSNSWDGKDGKKHFSSDLVLLEEAKDGRGFFPLVNTVRYMKDGQQRVSKRMTFEVPTERLAGYEPAVLEEVEVTFNQYGRIDSVKPLPEAKA